MYGVNDLISFLLEANLHQKKITITCDNEAVIDRLSDTYFDLADLDSAESDLIRDAKQALEEFTDCVLVWTRGHQDDGTPVSELPLLAQLIIECDIQPLIGSNLLYFASETT